MATTQPRTLESERAYQQALQVLPGGVSAAARIHPSLGRPFMASYGEGAYIFDVDGNRYVDLNTGFGATLLGHGHPAIRQAVGKAADLGLLCAFETPFQAELAGKLASLVPSIDLVRFTGSGTETTWHAIRTARVFTGRRKIIKFVGHFHGYNDDLAYNAWPPVTAEEGRQTSLELHAETAGLPPATRDDVIVLPWNDVAALEHALVSHAGTVAAVIMEPVNYNSGTLRLAPGYLERVRELTREQQVVLIFDEILSGFRTGTGGMQAYLGVTPDLCTLGKALGGGLPLSAFGGRREVMQAVAPLGRAVHSGTFNAHLVPILAANAFLDTVSEPAFYPALAAAHDRFYAELRGVFQRAGLPVWVSALGARFSLLFGLEQAPTDYRSAAAWDRQLATRFFGAAMEEGVYFHFAWHHGLSAAHGPKEIDQALEGIERAARRTSM